MSHFEIKLSALLFLYVNFRRQSSLGTNGMNTGPELFCRGQTEMALLATESYSICNKIVLHSHTMHAHTDIVRTL